MTLTAENYEQENLFWELVEATARDIVSVPLPSLKAKRREITSLPWERRRFFYNSDPFDVVISITGHQPSDLERRAYELLESKMLAAIERETPLRDQYIATKNKPSVRVEKNELMNRISDLIEYRTKNPATYEILSNEILLTLREVITKSLQESRTNSSSPMVTIPEFHIEAIDNHLNQPSLNPITRFIKRGQERANKIKT